MIRMIVGTPNSGKSQRAEDLACALAGEEPKWYVATMVPLGEGGQQRIQRHRQMRQGKGFITKECPYALGRLVEEVRTETHSPKVCLVECMSNWIGNALYAPEYQNWSEEEIQTMILHEVQSLGEAFPELILVTNVFPLEDPSYDAETKRYVQVVQDVNEALKVRVDQYEQLEKGDWKQYENL